MSRPAFLIQPNIQRLPNLLRDVREGEIRIPRFQRPFVWTTEQRLLLLQSIYEGMPIGSFLIWRTKEHDLRCYDHLGPLRLAWSSRAEEDEPKGGFRQYLIDGNQRLTTLYVALGQGLTGGEEESQIPADDQEEADTDENWPIFFDLDEKSFKINKRRTEPSETWLPLSILLNPYSLYDFQKQLLDRGAERALVNRAESLASTFKDYSIPVVPIVTEDLELATQSFQRVNSGGTPMNEVHMVSALTWSPDFDLNERIKEIQVELGEVGWQELEDKLILSTCKAALDLDIYYADTQVLRQAIKAHPKVLEEASASLKSAAEFLRRRCKIYGPGALPYSFQIVLLADAFWRSTDRLKIKLNDESEALLEKWFWLTTYTEHFAGISAVRLARTLDHLREVAAKGCDPHPPGATREVAPAPRRFDFKTARSRAMALRMADLQELHAGPDQNKAHQLLATYGRHAMPRLFSASSVPGKRGDGPENRVLGDPKIASAMRSDFRLTRLARLLDKRTDSIDHNAHPVGSGRADFLASHAISEGAARALDQNDIPNFLLLRREALLDIEETFVRNLGLGYERGS